jgi:RES domain-containing protein
MTGDRSRITHSQLRARLRRCGRWTKPWSGVVFRSTTPEYATSADLLSGEGSRVHGGRWNRAGSFAAVYASLDAETAMAEALAHVRYYRIPEAAAMPRVFVALEVRLASTLDLFDARVAESLGLRVDRPAEDWRAPRSRPAFTQLLGSAAESTGLEGILVPSAARAGGVNLVVFPHNLLRGSVMRVRKNAPK